MKIEAGKYYRLRCGGAVMGEEAIVYINSAGSFIWNDEGKYYDGNNFFDIISEITEDDYKRIICGLPVTIEADGTLPNERNPKSLDDAFHNEPAGLGSFERISERCTDDNRVASLQTLLNTSEAALSHAESEIGKMHEEIKALKAERDRLSTANQQFEKEIFELEGVIQSDRAEIRALKETIRFGSKDIDNRSGAEEIKLLKGQLNDALELLDKERRYSERLQADRLERIATATMQGIVVSNAIGSNWGYDVVSESIRVARALIAELDKEPNL